MIEPLAILALGFFLGVRHAIDPDHVIAVSTIVARHRTPKSAVLIGLVWGLGHTFTILVVGGGIIFFSWVIPWRVGLTMEFAVGVMLIALGIANLRGIRGLLSGTLAPTETTPAAIHSHPHSHGDYVHTHPHRHGPEIHSHGPEQTPVAWFDHHFAGLGLYQLARPLVVGIVHGLAGSAAVALLVLATIPDPRWSILYLVIFSFGTIVGMMLITGALALPFALGGGSAQFAGRLRVASGLISIAFGCLLAYQIGFVGGLFSGHPR